MSVLTSPAWVLFFSFTLLHLHLIHHPLLPHLLSSPWLLLFSSSSILSSSPSLLTFLSDTAVCQLLCFILLFTICLKLQWSFCFNSCLDKRATLHQTFCFTFKHGHWLTLTTSLKTAYLGVRLLISRWNGWDVYPNWSSSSVREHQATPVAVKCTGYRCSHFFPFWIVPTSWCTSIFHGRPRLLLSCSSVPSTSSAL
jgi:hypothetical protein